MKNLISAILCLIMVLGLVACSGGEGNSQDDGTITTAETGELSLPLETQLILGTMKLDGTDLEVTADQASQLITLWKAVQSLSTSDTTAQEEMEAVMNQIQNTMTAEQLESIQAMDLRQGDVPSMMEELGILPVGSFMGGQGGGVEGYGSFNPGELPGGEIIISGTPGADGQAFEVPEGGFRGRERPEGGFQGEGGPGSVIIEGEGPRGGFQGGEGIGGQGFNQDMDPEQIATLQAGRAGRTGFQNRAYLFLIDPMIQYLEGKLD